MDSSLVSKLLIIIDNQRLLFDKLKNIESRLAIIERNTTTNTQPNKVIVVDNEDEDEDEVILFKPQIKNQALTKN
jgi:hypothetical protein